LTSTIVASAADLTARAAQAIGRETFDAK